MRRFLSLLVAGGLAASACVVLAAPAGAQTGSLAEFCSARVELNAAFSQEKAQSLAQLDRMVTNAPAAVAPAITEIRDAFKKKGPKAFDSEELAPALATADSFIYETCPGTKVPVTAIDYEFQGVPATLKAGPTNFKLTNAAPKEFHEMGIVKMTAAGAAMDPEKLLALPEKKQEKLLDFSSSFGMFAPPGEAGYTLANLEPGEYLYACFIPVGSKKKGAPHFTEGMYGTFTVS
ncbi:MAG: hypothetical protein FJW95_08805 [Actinobacteria bacterium]|nr:hypothetical protein [Actinomycetota bacterium]